MCLRGHVVVHARISISVGLFIRSNKGSTSSTSRMLCCIFEETESDVSLSVSSAVVARLLCYDRRGIWIEQLLVLLSFHFNLTLSYVLCEPMTVCSVRPMQQQFFSPTVCIYSLNYLLDFIYITYLLVHLEFMRLSCRL